MTIVWYISPTGSDSSGTGLISNPYLTINKCISVGSDGDSISALSGTYTLTSVINITKSFNITSTTGNANDVIFSSSYTIFNVQCSNVVIQYLTLKTSYDGELLIINRLSLGDELPTFFIGISVNNCNIEYTSIAMALNGTYNISNNIFTRLSTSIIANVLNIYSSRGTCNISNNTINDHGPIQKILNFTSSGQYDTYFDICNSKGGIMNINNNIINYTNVSQSVSFIYFDYFNQYNVHENSNYTLNTRINLFINNNSINSFTRSRFVNVSMSNANNFAMFNLININTNTINNTDYGIIHLGKSITTPLTIASTDLTRNVFKIYNNTSDNIETLNEFIMTNFPPRFWYTWSFGINSNSWSDIITNKIMTAYNTSGSLPTYDSTSELIPFVKLVAANSNYFKFGSQVYNMSSGLSIIAVVRFRNTTMGYERIVEFGTSADPNNYIFFNRKGQTQDILGMVNINGVQAQVTIPIGIVNGSWQIFAISIATFGVTIYSDNSVNSSFASFTLSSSKTYTETAIGNSTYQATYPDIDVRDVFIYENTLTASTVNSIFTKIKSYYSIPNTNTTFTGCILGFSPKYWYRSDYIVNFTASGVSSWTDFIENKIITAYTTGTLPYYITTDSFPLVRLISGYHNYFKFGSQVYNMTSGLSIIAVVKFLTTGTPLGYERIVEFGTQASDPNNNIIFSRYGQTQGIIGQVNINGVSAVAIIPNGIVNLSWQIFAMTIAANGVTVYANSSSGTYTPASLTLSSNKTYAETAIGNSTYQAQWPDMDIADIIIYERNLNSTDINSIFTKIKSNYNI
jgi:hypothetical protein